MDDPAAVRVLVVDDDDDLRSLVQTLLDTAAPSGTEVYVEHASSLTDAARRLTDGPRPSVTLLDLGLSAVPQAAPVAGVAVLGSVPDAPPLIAITSSTPDRGRQAVAAGATDYLDKADLAQPSRLWRAIVVAIERQRRQRELSDQGTELVRATTQLAHLSARLRHDLRSPLAIAISALDTIEQVELGPEARTELLAMVRERLRDLGRRLDELAGTLAASELGGGPARQQVLLEELLAEVRGDLAPWDRDRLRLEVVGVERIWAARRLLRGLLGGLVRNALQHNPDVDVVVHVEARREEGSAVLVVADDGVGIDPELREAVFDVGWTTAEPPTAGIGLAAANSAAATMEGSIRAVDSPYGGAAFRVELPQRESRTASHAGAG